MAGWMLGGCASCRGIQGMKAAGAKVRVSWRVESARITHAMLWAQLLPLLLLLW